MADSTDSTMAVSDATDPLFKTMTWTNKSRHLKATLVQQEVVKGPILTQFGSISCHHIKIQKWTPSQACACSLQSYLNMNHPLLLWASPLQPSSSYLKTCSPWIKLISKAMLLWQWTHKWLQARSSSCLLDANSSATAPSMTLNLTATSPNSWHGYQKKRYLSNPTPFTIGYLTQLHLQLTNQYTLNTLLGRHISGPQACCGTQSIAQRLTKQCNVKSSFCCSGSPPFALYKTKTTYGHNRENVSMDVLRIKCANVKCDHQ